MMDILTCILSADERTPGVIDEIPFRLRRGLSKLLILLG